MERNDCIFRCFADVRLLDASGRHVSAQGWPCGGIARHLPDAQAAAEIRPAETTPHFGALDRMLLGALWPQRLVDHSKARLPNWPIACTVRRVVEYTVCEYMRA